MAWGTEPTPVWTVRTVRVRSATNPAIRSSTGWAAAGRARRAGGRRRTQPRIWLTWLDAPERAGHLGVGLQEEPGPTDERRHVVGVEPEAEVAVPVRPRRRRQHERVRRPVGQNGAHLAEVGYKLNRPGPKARPRHTGQAVRDVPESITERAVQVAPVVDRVHLMDADAVEGGCVGLDGVEQRHRSPFANGTIRPAPRPM
jgi:hypothetical protein